MKAYLGNINDTVDDAQIALAITAASRAVDRHCNRQFGLVAAPEERTYTAYWSSDLRKYVVYVDDFMTTTGLVITDDEGTAITDYTLKRTNADKDGVPWTHIVLNSGGNCRGDGITVTARYGWTTVPVAVQQATVLQAMRLFKRRGAPFGVAGSPELGSELRLLSKVDPDVAVVLGPYLRWWSAA
ncbi:phage gp6-like head-tail connector protein [Kribbella deserti]|uniref:Phage gp6-like head-tail connector protein n=1 Tax=Kribbella deserti TaxID=1926257 RepID=A0ABV6QV94_9ACTN